MRTWIALPTVVLVLAAPACRRELEDDAMSAPPPPPALAIAPVRESMSLDAKLNRLDTELASAIAGGLDRGALRHMERAEAITDRFLEAPPPVAWLAEGYDVEARLRQLQAQADRIIAELRRGLRSEEVLNDVRLLRRQVRALRVALRRPGGGEAPPSLDSLMASVPEQLRQARIVAGMRGEPAGADAPGEDLPGLIGTPVTLPTSPIVPPDTTS